MYGIIEVVIDNLAKYKLLVKVVKYRYQALFSLLMLFIVSSIIFDTIFFHFEGMGGLSIFEFVVKLLYFNVVTGTTIGYGDISPSMWQTQLVLVFYAPIAVITFAGILGSIITISVVKFRKKALGTAKVYDVDVVIGGGYKEKIESVVSALINNNPSLKLCVISDVYSDKPEIFDNLSVSWINGKITDSDKLDLIKVSVDKYCVLSINPSNKKEDSFILLAYDAINNKEVSNKNLRILGEVVRNNLLGFYRGDDIEYLQISRSAIIAKELMFPGTYAMINSVFSNTLPGNQYNDSLKDLMNWSDVIRYYLKKNAVVIGYIDNEKQWNFFPKDKNLLLPKGTTVKVLAKSPLKDMLCNSNVLLIGYDEYKTCQIVDLYLTDSRYKDSIITVVYKDKNNELEEVICNNSKLNFISGDQTNERFLQNDINIESYDKIFILNENQLDSDANNFLTYKIIRELNPDAQIICEIVSSDLRFSLEEKYEDLMNQFTEPAQAGQIVQEFQDPGALFLVEKLSDDTMPEEVEDIEIIEETTWYQLRTDFILNKVLYPGGYKLPNSNWIWQDDNDVEIPVGTLVKCMKK